MSYTVDFSKVSTVGLTSSPVNLAGTIRGSFFIIKADY